MFQFGFFQAFKRVFNVLNCLLNYCNFVRYTYAETIQDLKITLQDRDDFRMIKHQLLTNIEKAKIKKENDIKLIRDFDTKIPRQRTINEELENKEKRLRQELNKIHVECEKSDVDLIGAKTELENMKNLIVSDQEIDNILSAREQTEKQLEEQDQFSIAVRQRLKENAHGIEKAQEITTIMDSLLSSFRIDAGEMKNKNKEVEDLKTEINILKSKISRIQLEIETLSQSIEMKNKNITHIILKRDEIKKSYSLKGAEKKKELIEKENFLRRLVITEASLATANQRLRDEQQLLFKVASNVIKHISIKMFDKNSQQEW